MCNITSNSFVIGEHGYSCENKKVLQEDVMTSLGSIIIPDVLVAVVIVGILFVKNR